MEAVGAHVITATASAQSTLAYQKDYSLLPGGAAEINFNIGIIPFHAELDIPVTVQASFTLDALLQVTVGSTFQALYGDNYKTWAEHTGWDHVKSTPVFQ